jgi:hypothetical protein
MEIEILKALDDIISDQIGVRCMFISPNDGLIYKKYVYDNRNAFGAFATERCLSVWLHNGFCSISIDGEAFKSSTGKPGPLVPLASETIDLSSTDLIPRIEAFVDHWMLSHVERRDKVR